jgi:hypothetical protein
MSLFTKSPILALALVANLCLAGSAAQQTLDELTTEKPGSPYHWISHDEGRGGTSVERELKGVPGETVADETTKKDVLKTIARLEQKFGGTQPPVLAQVRQVSKTGGQYNEIWVIKRAGAQIPYTVGLTPTPANGTDLDVQGPWD